jgi:NAD(P)-dependent dehydrogenase (short-subunit alcohol dehydrogenase family)
MGRLADKNILITGGNSGIGLAAAQEFDREGARVAICGLNERSLQAAKETLGAGSLAVRADVSNLTDLDRMFATIKREFGHLDGVFVNAGYSEFLLSGCCINQIATHRGRSYAERFFLLFQFFDPTG